MNQQALYQLIKTALDEMQHTQLNIASDAAREELAKRLVKVIDNT